MRRTERREIGIFPVDSPRISGTFGDMRAITRQADSIRHALGWWWCANIQTEVA